MKRTITQKVKKVPTCAADSFDALFKLYLGYVGKHPVGASIPTEVNNRRACTSAAMLGLAISMGATGLLLPRHGDEAMAFEPIAAEPTIPNLPVIPEANVSPAPKAEVEVATKAMPSASAKRQTALEQKATRHPVVEHRVQKGETLWDLSKAYEVKPEAIVASNTIKPSTTLPVGQKLKIPTVNGIVHEVKPGDTVETLSESYGVKPAQLQASAPVSELGQFKTGESVTVPGNVDSLLKARQDVALKRLQQQRNRLNDSLAELRSEESTKSSELATIPTEAASPEQSPSSVTLPSAVLKNQELFATPQPVATAVVPQPMATVPSSSVVIPVPTPEMAMSPTVAPKAAGQADSSVVIPVPTPEVAMSPTVAPKAAGQAESPMVIPVPTPEMAASPTPVTPSVSTVPTLRTVPAPNSETAAKPQGPQPVVIQALGASSAANVYSVKPGDTLDAIAHRSGVSRAELMQANALTNPHLLRINQQLKIPQGQPAASTTQTVALFPGINPKMARSASGREQLGVQVPTIAVPTVSGQSTASDSTLKLPAPRSMANTVRTESTNGESKEPESTVVADNKPSQSANSQQSIYVEKLKADILRLREEYRQNRGGSSGSETASIVVPTAATSVSSTLNNPSASSRINPEFNAKLRNDSLQANRGKRQQPIDEQSSIPIEVPPPETTGSASPRGLVASAPVPSGNYNRAIRTPLGQTVSPEMPSLSAPDMYRPENAEQFNGYIWPTKGVVTSGYGMRWGRMHKGIDIAAPIGTPVVAAAPGIVVSAGWNSGGYGNLVEIQHPDGSVTLYAHNNRILVRRGQEVQQGQQISEMGSTGFSTGPHCHFEVHPSGRGAVNPIAYLPSKRG
ncbi:MAG TPA: peptidoglycan DD-metalloendopeptidase family protein [Waterburya sp.]